MVAEAAILCPSFFRADVVNNPTRWDTMKAKVTMAIIGYLQRRRESRRIAMGPAT